MNETTDSLASMHIDHRYWKIQHDVWRDDIRRWQQQYEAILADLGQLEDAIRHHGEALKSHRESINGHEAVLDFHEHALKDYEMRDEGTELQEPMQSMHEQQAIDHLDLRDEHERMKRHHHAVIAQLRTLKATINELVGDRSAV